MRRTSLALLLLATAPYGGSAAAETRVVAWGDSITYGYYDGTSASNDCTKGEPDNNAPEECGYPGRLGSRLDDPGLFSPVYEVEILNLGKGGERTNQAISRIDRPGWACPCTEASPTPCPINSLKYWVCNGTVTAEDLFVLMEGTNDISRERGVESILADYETIAAKAKTLGLNVVVSSITPRHPDACEDPGNNKAESLNDGIAALAAEKGWPMVDPYNRLDAIADLFGDHYQHWDPMKCGEPPPTGCGDTTNCDPVGHPNRSGFDKMTYDGGAFYAKTFEAVVRGALPPRLTMTAPDAPHEPGVELHFAVALFDLAQTAELTWDFGDGTVISDPPDESPELQDHTYAESGPYLVKATAEHANGGKRTASTLLRVGVLFADGFESGDTSNWQTGG